MKRLKFCTLLVLLFTVMTTITHAVEIENGEFENMLQQPQEHWYNFTLMGKKIGYLYNYIEKTDYQGEPAIRSRTDLVMHFKAIGTDLKIEQTRIEYAGPDLMPRYFLLTSNESGLKQVEGKVIDGTAYITTTLNGETTETEADIPPDTISELMIDSLLSKNPLKVGDTHTFHLFNFDLLQAIKTELHVVSEETVTYQHQEKPVWLLELTMDIMGGITTRMWLSTDDSTLYRTETDMMGLALTATKTDKKTALDGIEEVDLVLQTRLLPTGERPKTGASRLVANVRLTSGNLKETFLTNNHQKMERADEQTGTLTIDVPKVDETNCPSLPIQQEELHPFLSATAYIQTDHPAITTKAEEILAGETNSWHAAKLLCQWVYKSIDEKNLSGGYGTSLTTLETLSGDCTEHTVLFIALARSVGIPARICSGLVFAKDAFYYHFWPEVYVGTWIPMDPTLNQVIADANHIQLGGSTLESDTMMELSEGAFRTLNQLEIVIIE